MPRRPYNKRNGRITENESKILNTIQRRQKALIIDTTFN